MNRLILGLLLVVSCSDLYPTVETEVQWSDLIGTTWQLNGETNILQHTKEQWTFSCDSIIYTIRKFRTWDSVFTSERVFKGYIKNLRKKLEPEDRIPLFTFIWCRKEYGGTTYEAPVTDYSVCSEWFAWKIQNDSLYFGYYEDGDYNYWILERAPMYMPW